MKNKFSKILIICLLGSFFHSCETPLEEIVFSELAPENFLKTQEGINSLLNNAYATQQRTGQESFNAISTFQMPSGEVWNRGGSIETDLTPMRDYTWDSNHPRLNTEWTNNYRAIRDANILLDNLANSEFDLAFVTDISAQAKFIRAKAMIDIYDFFGTGPLFTSSVFDELEKSRASDAEWIGQIETDMTEAMNALPPKPAYGRASSGSAAAILCKFYLNQKRWNDAVTMADKVISSQLYELFPTYIELFAIANEGNKEIIYTHPASSLGTNSAVQINPLVFPPDYPRPSNVGLFAARCYFFDDFVDSYHPDDTRQAILVKSYVSTSGVTVQGYGFDQTLPLKYELDPSAVGANHGNDWPEIRYADILLSKAEALNELNGPNQQSVDLLNMIRTRASVPLYSLADFSTKEAFRDKILAERSWEFAFEGKKRQDQIRHGVMISLAKARGKNAQPFHVLFPIPQSEMDANRNMTQNPGY
ncbi:MAG: RagB/SusD family nutrient uptake outer membrane protein [Saprospiraceae bacterium]